MSERLTEALQAAQKTLTRHLWVPADAIIFTPQVLAESFGDGRALFKVTTINNRPAYWIVQGCSKWSIATDYVSADLGDDFGDHVDEVLEAIEEQFGTTRYYEMNARGDWVDEETKRFIPRKWAEYPVIDSDMGCSWGRLDWPDLPGIGLMPHPLDASVRILAAPLLRDPAGRLALAAQEGGETDA